MSSISHHIFREYDVRGVVGDDVTSEVAGLLCRAYGSELRTQFGSDGLSVALGHDNRHSSNELAKAFVEGLKAT